MKRRFFRIAAIAIIGITGVSMTGCAPMVYDSNPHFSNHRVPPRPLPGQPGYGRPVSGNGVHVPSRPGAQPGPNNNRPTTQPDHNPNTGNPGRPGGNQR